MRKAIWQYQLVHGHSPCTEALAQSNYYYKDFTNLDIDFLDSNGKPKNNHFWMSYYLCDKIYGGLNNNKYPEANIFFPLESNPGYFGATGTGVFCRSWASSPALQRGARICKALGGELTKTQTTGDSTILMYRLPFN